MKAEMLKPFVILSNFFLLSRENQSVPGGDNMEASRVESELDELGLGEGLS